MHDKSLPFRLTTVAVFVAVNNGVELTFISDASQDELREPGARSRTSVSVGCLRNTKVRFV